MSVAERLSGQGSEIYTPDDALHAIEHPPLVGVFDPIRERIVGLGEATQVEAETLPNRLDGWFQVELNGFSHGVRVTDPEPNQELGLTLMHLPGFTEVIESGPGKAIHDRLAALLPGARIVSIASDGVGNLGEKLTLENMWDHGLEAMAEERLKLVRILAGSDHVILQGLSMGSVIANIIAERNMRAELVERLKLLHFDTALVTPENVRAYMLGLFLPSMLSDVPREFAAMLRRYGPREAVKQLVIHPEHLKGNLLPIIVEGLDIKRGMEFPRIERVVQALGTTTVSGQLDPLAQFRMWKHLKHDNNQGVHISTVRFRGHGMVADGAAAADKMHHVIERHHILDQLVA